MATQTVDACHSAALPTVPRVGVLRRCAVVHGCWREAIGGRAGQILVAELRILGVASDPVDMLTGTGVFVLPLTASTFAHSGQYGSIVVFASPARLGIHRHVYVVVAVVNGSMAVRLETDVPMMLETLTPHVFQPNADQQMLFGAQLLAKVAERPRSCSETIHALQCLSGPRTETGQDPADGGAGAGPNR